MAAGYTVSVANQSGGDITVALATSTDTIDTVTNTTQTLSAKEVRRYIVNSTATGYITASDRVVAASDTIAGKIEIATQAEQETGTDTTRAVTPGRQHLHQSAAKFWIKWDTSGTAITASYNVTSVTNTGTGKEAVTIATDFSSANWCVVGNATTADANNATNSRMMTMHTMTAGGIEVLTSNTDNPEVYADTTAAYVAGFGDQ